MSEVDTYIISTHSLTKRLTLRELQDRLMIAISTHSLTKRLTQKHLPCRLMVEISTHSLTKRLTAILDKNTFI